MPGHLQKRLLSGIDAETGVIDKKAGLAGAIDGGQRFEPIGIGGLHDRLRGFFHD